LTRASVAKVLILNIKSYKGILSEKHVGPRLICWQLIPVILWHGLMKPIHQPMQKPIKKSTLKNYWFYQNRLNVSLPFRILFLSCRVLPLSKLIQSSIEKKNFFQFHAGGLHRDPKSVPGGFLVAFANSRIQLSPILTRIPIKDSLMEALGSSSGLTCPYPTPNHISNSPTPKNHHPFWLLIDTGLGWILKPVD